MRGRGQWRAHRPLLSLLLVLSALLLGCEAPKSSGPVSMSSPPATLSAGPLYYVSVGDSYAAGYQPIKGRWIGHTTTAGFAYQLAAKSTLRGHRLTLVNYGCGGVTTTSLVTQKGCLPALLAPRAPNYAGQSQASAALAFVRAHRGRIGLVTISIGGNDVALCPKAAQPADCVRSKLPLLSANLKAFLRQLREAAGAEALIVGLTYPDVLLGGDVMKVTPRRALTQASVDLFKTLLNPTLKAAYATVGATFVDVTAGTGAYLPTSQTTVLAPYGRIPVSVAKVCELTYYCELGDIHPKNVGYAFIASLIARVLPKA